MKLAALLRGRAPDDADRLRRKCGVSASRAHQRRLTPSAPVPGKRALPHHSLFRLRVLSAQTTKRFDVAAELARGYLENFGL